MEALATTLSRLSGLETAFEPVSPQELEQMKADTENSIEGNEHVHDGYQCSACRNKGFIAKVGQMSDGTYTTVTQPCKCVQIRQCIRQMKKSGLKDIIKDYTFERYEATEPWQQTIKAAAMEYAENPDGWFFLGGQSGSGKTHLCTAICRKFLLESIQVVYMMWMDDIERIKSMGYEDPEGREKLMQRFKQAKVLYIDDLFKIGQNQDGSRRRPTSKDINIAFEIINFRRNSGLRTIISSEWDEADIVMIDEATGGRIFEHAKSFSIDRNPKRNYRIRKMVTV